MTEDKEHKDIPRVRTLSDEPASKDAFGPHQRIAEAIADMIEHEEGGKAIALTGDWGSGKSTVIVLLNQEIIKRGLNDQIKIFNFDIWPHENESIRRGFLEELIDYLLSLYWLKNTIKWRKTKESLSQIKIISTSKTTPKLTPEGRTFAIFILLSPITFAIYQWFLSFWNILNIPAEYLIPLILIMILGVASPFLYALYLRYIHSQKEPHKDFLNVLIHTTSTESSTESVQSSVPTVIEFKSLYQQIMQEALSDKTRRLAVVIDNYDRLEKQEMKNKWRTIRTFIDFDSNKMLPFDKQLWLVVPFKKDKFSDIWDRLDEDKDHKYAEAVKEKTFSSKFEIPEPVLSKWHDYFMELLKTVFPPDNFQSDYFSIYRLYYLHGDVYGKPPTPRNLIAFVNDLGTNYRIWRDKYSLRALAVYTLHRKSGSDFMSILTEPIEEKFHDKLSLEILGESYGKYGWRGAFASLYYNLPEDEAMQMLLHDPITAAIEKGGQEHLDEVMKYTNVEGFSLVLFNTIRESRASWPQPDQMVALAGWAMGNLNLDNSELANDSWKFLCAQAKKVESWNPMTEEIGIGLANLANHRDSLNENIENFLPSFKEKLQISLSNTDAVKENNDRDKRLESITQYVAGIQEFINGIADKSYMDQFSVKANAADYIHVMFRLNDKHNNANAQFYRTSNEVSTADVVQRLSELARVSTIKEGFHEGHLKVIKAARETKQEYDWKPLIDALNLDGRLGEADNEEARNRLKYMLFFMNHQPYARERLESLAKDGSLYPIIAKAKRTSDWGLIALCVMPFIYHYTWGENPIQRRQMQGGPDGQLTMRDIIQDPNRFNDLIKECANVAIEYELIPLILGITQGRDRKLVGAVLRDIIARDDVHELIPAETILQYGSNIRILLEPSPYDRLLYRSARFDDLLPKIMEAGYNVDDDYQYMYKHLDKQLDDSIPNWREFRKWLKGNEWGEGPNGNYYDSQNPSAPL